MEEALKKKWVKALRSGKYQQTTNKLKDARNESYCCLGVLCEITPGIKFDDRSRKYYLNGSKFKALADKQQDGILVSDDNKYFFDYESFPSSICKELGLNRRMQMDGRRLHLQDKLAAMNDAGVPFDEIADYIEKVL